MLFTKAHGTQIDGELERMIRYRTVFNSIREIHTEEVEAYGTSATAFPDDQTYINILKYVCVCAVYMLPHSYIGVRGFPRAGYFIPGRDGIGVWTFGNLYLPPFKREARMFLKHARRTMFL